MDKQSKPEITTGNGHINPILASASDHTADASKQSQARTSIGSGSTKPLSLAELVSLLQTLCFDARTLECGSLILAEGNIAAFVIRAPASIVFSVSTAGHVCIGGVPVSEVK